MHAVKVGRVKQKIKLAPTQRDIINIVIMQAVWLACVLGGTVWGWAAAALLLFCYQCMFRASIQELRCIVAIAVIGFGVDSAMSMMGLMVYPDKNLLAFIPLPGWMAALWLAFATLFFHGLQWLRTRPLLAATLGAIGGPVTYYSGSQLHAVTLAMTLTTFCLCYGLLWAIMTPLFGSMAARTETTK